jgi:hypothetical protein
MQHGGSVVLYRAYWIDTSCFICDLKYHNDVPVSLTCFTSDRIACFSALTVCSYTSGKQRDIQEKHPYTGLEIEEAENDTE